MSAENAEEPVPRRLRSSEPDLSITVGIGDNSKEYCYHSQVMATHSTYIDTMLATPMKESQSRQLTFPDLTPEIWELMMKALDPAEARQLSIENAVKPAPVYDKYSFERGLKMCDQVITELFEQNYENAEDGIKPSHDLYLLIDAFLVASGANLSSSVAGYNFFRSVLNHGRRYGRLMFSADHIKKLVPLIVEKRLLAGSVGKDWSTEEILNPMFPEYFVFYYRDYQQQKCAVELSLSGSGCEADGVFTRYAGGWFESGRSILDGDVSRNIVIGKMQLDGDWVISGKTEPENDEGGEPEYKILWENPFSGNMTLPPTHGWEPVDELVHGSPRIDHISFCA